MLPCTSPAVEKKKKKGRKVSIVSLHFITYFLHTVLSQKIPQNGGVSQCLCAKLFLSVSVMLIYHVNPVADILMAAHIPAKTAHIQQGDRLSHSSSLPGESGVED